MACVCSPLYLNWKGQQIMPHAETQSCLQKAESLIEIGDADSFRYASLQLRMGIEYLFYELIPLYRDELPDDILTKWQPKDVLDAVLACDPSAHKETADYSLRVFRATGSSFQSRLDNGVESTHQANS